MIGTLAVTGCPGPSGGPRGVRHAGERLAREGRFEQAAQDYASRLAAARRGGDAKRVVRATLALARLQGDLGRPGVAVALLEQAIQEARKRKAHRAAARLYLALGQHHLRYGRSGVAADHWLWGRIHARAARWPALQTRVAAHLALAAVVRGELGEAVKRLAEATLHASKARGRAGAAAHLDLGRAYARTGDQARSRRAFERARKGFEAARMPWREAEAWVGLAQLARSSGRAAAARRGYREALTRLTRAGATRRFAEVAWALADALEASRQPAEAHRFRSRARAALGRLGDTDQQARLDRAEALALARRGRHQDALPRAQRAARALEASGDRLAAGLARVQVARALVQLGRAAEAVGELTRVLDHATAAKAPELSFLAYALLGSLSETLLDRPAQAARFQQGAVRALARVRAGLSLVGVDDPALEEDAYYQLARVAIKQWRRSGDPRHFNAALAAVEQGRGRELVDWLSRAGASIADDAKSRRQVARLSGEEQHLVAALTRPGLHRRMRRALYERLAEVRRRRTRIERDALRFGAAQPAPASAGILKRALGPQDVLLIFQVGQRGSLVIALNDRQSKVADLPGRARLEAAVTRWLTALRGTTSAARTAGALLRRLILDPVAALWRGRARVHLVLSGPLRRVGFAALPVSPKAWWGQEAAFARLPSPAAWLKLRATPRAADQTTVRRVAPGSPAALRKQGLSGARWIHLPGRLRLGVPVLGRRQPVLQLGKAGRLLLRDVMGLAVDTRLVSVGALAAGPAQAHGHASLARAFLLAGAQRVLLPRRPPGVAPEAYRRALLQSLTSGTDHAAAQRAAQMAALRAARGHPRALATFALYGTF